MAKKDKKAVKKNNENLFVLTLISIMAVVGVISFTAMFINLHYNNELVKPMTKPFTTPAEVLNRIERLEVTAQKFKESVCEHKLKYIEVWNGTAPANGNYLFFPSYSYYKVCSKCGLRQEMSYCDWIVAKQTQKIEKAKRLLIENDYTIEKNEKTEAEFEITWQNNFGDLIS